MTADFDAYADSYRDAVEHSIGFSGQELDYFAHRKADHLLELTARLLGEPAGLSVLDVGCGVGTTDAFLTGRFGTLHGVDVAGDAIARAAERNPLAHYQPYDGRALPFDDGSLDVAFAICVLHHIPLDERSAFATEMRRVIRPGGLAVLFEHNPVNPLTRLAVSRCEFDDGVTLVFRRRAVRILQGAGLRPVEARYIMFFTSDRPWLRAVERSLRGFPLGAQHYVAARR